MPSSRSCKVCQPGLCFSWLGVSLAGWRQNRPPAVPCRITSRGRDIEIAVLGFLVLLDKLPQSLRNRGVVGCILFGLGAKAVPSGGMRDVANLGLLQGFAATTFHGIGPPIDSTGDDSTHVVAGPSSHAPETLA